MSSSDNAQPMQIPTPDPALKRLNMLVGTWDLKGRTLDSKVDNIFGWTSFEWMPGGFFLQVRGEISIMAFHVQSLEIIGTDPSGQTFLSNVYSNISGAVEQYHWDVQGETVTHWEESAKYTGTLSADGKTLAGGWRPTNGGDGTDGSAYDAVMTRRDGEK